MNPELVDGPSSLMGIAIHRGKKLKIEVIISKLRQIDVLAMQVLRGPETIRSMDGSCRVRERGDAHDHHLSREA